MIYLYVITSNINPAKFIISQILNRANFKNYPSINDDNNTNNKTINNNNNNNYNNAYNNNNNNNNSNNN